MPVAASVRIPDPLLRLGENRLTIRSLTEYLGSNQGVVPFVGAGMSAPFGFPLWREFLLEQARETAEPEQVERFLDVGDYETAAQVIYEDRTATRFDFIISETFNRPITGQWPDFGAVRWLPSLNDGLVITTNFDRVLVSCP